MSVKIIADSSCDIKEFPGVDFASVPLTISTEERSFVDDSNLDVHEMLDYLATYHARSYTSCPSIDAWLKCFGDSEVIYVVTMTSTLSGTYNSAMTARGIYLEEHPDARIHVFDTLSTGPEMRLTIEKLAECITQGLDEAETINTVTKYLKRTRLFFSLESLHNMAQNGRVSKVVAAAAGFLGIRILGTASPEGDLQPLNKCRNEKRMIGTILEHLSLIGYEGGKFRINHIENSNFAHAIAECIRTHFPKADILIYPAGGLCSYYAERGGVMLGIECS